MLVIGRKPGETVEIGEGVRVKVLRIRGSRVILGVEAHGQRIDRDEVARRRQEAERRAG